MKKVIILLSLLLPCILFSQQLADTTFNPPIPDPEYKFAEGPIVFIDEGHHNFHTMDGRFRSFANLLERDGYKVMEYKGEFMEDKLAKGKILVIANALSENVEDWVIPDPSAFSESEIETLKQWVYEGGSLFLIADHMPFPDASKDLARVFGFEFTNGFVFDSRSEHIISRRPVLFSKNDGTLKKNMITSGRNSDESVDSIATFTGQAIKIPDDASSILTFGKEYVNYLPDTAWVFDENTPHFNVEGWSQGAFKEYGRGKIVVFGEAAMFTAQLAGPNHIKVGMNSDSAPENYQLLLNIIHWLDGRLE